MLGFYFGFKSIIVNMEELELLHGILRNQMCFVESCTTVNAKQLSKLRKEKGEKMSLVCKIFMVHSCCEDLSSAGIVKAAPCPLRVFTDNKRSVSHAECIASATRNRFCFLVLEPSSCVVIWGLRVSFGAPRAQRRRMEQRDLRASESWSK